MNFLDEMHEFIENYWNNNPTNSIETLFELEPGYFIEAEWNDKNTKVVFYAVNDNTNEKTELAAISESENDAELLENIKLAAEAIFNYCQDKNISPTEVLHNEGDYTEEFTLGYDESKETEEDCTVFIETKNFNKLYENTILTVKPWTKRYEFYVTTPVANGRKIVFGSDSKEECKKYALTPLNRIELGDTLEQFGWDLMNENSWLMNYIEPTERTKCMYCQSDLIDDEKNSGVCKHCADKLKTEYDTSPVSSPKWTGD